MKNYHLGDVAGDAVEDVDEDEEDCDQDRHPARHTFRWHQKAETRFEKGVLGTKTYKQPLQNKKIKIRQHSESLLRQAKYFKKVIWHWVCRTSKKYIFEK